MNERMKGKRQLVTRPSRDIPPEGSEQPAAPPSDPPPPAPDEAAALDDATSLDKAASDSTNITDDDKMELETLVALNGALQRALRDSDAELMATMHGALQEQRRLRAKLKEVLQETVLKKSDSGEENATFASPATEKVITLKKRTEELSLRIQLMKVKERTSEEQAAALEVQIQAARESSSRCSGSEAPPLPYEQDDSEMVGDQSISTEEQSHSMETKDSQHADLSLKARCGSDTDTEEALAAEEAREIRRLIDQTHGATQRLLDLRTHNQQLRHDLKWARKVLSCEVGDPATVSAAMEAVAGSGGQWRGRAEQVSLMQQRIAELQEQLQHVREEYASLQKKRMEKCPVQPMQADALSEEQSGDGIPVSSTRGSTRSANTGACGWGAAAALERQEVAKSDEREARAAQRTAESQAEVLKAHNAEAEAAIHGMRERIAQLTAKAEHDKQLAKAASEQLRAAEGQVKQRERRRDSALEDFEEQRRSIQQQIVRTKSVTQHLQVVLEEKKKILEDLNNSMNSAESRRNAKRPSAVRLPSVQSTEDPGRMAMLRRVLMGKEEERGRLQKLVDHLSARLAEKVRQGALAKEAARRERQRTAALETEVGRLELQRPGATEQRRSTQEADLRSRIAYMTEENATLRNLLERTLREREDEIKKYAAIFNQQGLLKQMPRSRGRPSTSESLWSAAACVPESAGQDYN